MKLCPCCGHTKFTVSASVFCGDCVNDIRRLLAAKQDIQQTKYWKVLGENQMKTKKTLINVLGIVIVLTGWLCFANWANRNNNGIVTVPNWENGVAFCGKEYGAVVHSDEATLWADGIATYVVNKGHEADPQIKVLEWEARSTCGNN